MRAWPLMKLLLNLGILAKDHIQSEISDSIDIDNAIKADKPYVILKGRYLMLPEKVYCRQKTNPENGHTVLVDDKGKIWYDITYQNLREREIKAKQKYADQGCIFYPAYTLNEKNSNVWKSDILDGYFRRIGKDSTRFKPEDEFVRGEIKKVYNWIVTGSAKYSSGNRYSSSGELLTPEIVINTRNRKAKEKCLQDGNKFYPTYTLNEHEEVVFYCYRDIDTNEVVYYNNCLKYYTKGKISNFDVEIRKPHHEEIDHVEHRTVIKEILDQPKYNIDGTKWVE